METYEIIDKIEAMRKERGWSSYRLAEEACIAHSTLFNMNTRRTLPSLTTLGCICDAFGVTLAEFFSEGDTDALTQDEQSLVKSYRKLSYQNKQAVRNLVESLK